MSKLAVIVPVHNRKTQTLKCLSQLAIIQSTGWGIRVVVVDDGSMDGTWKAIRENFPRVVVLRGDGGLWWTGAVNMGVKWARENGYDGILTLNDDLIWDTDFLEEILACVMKYPNALVSAIKLELSNNGENRILTAGFLEEGVFHELRNKHHGRLYSELRGNGVLSCDALTGAALFVPNEVFDKIGLFDYKRFPHNWGDIEFTHRAKRAGFNCLVATRSKIYTESNPNYHRHCFLEVPKWNYLRIVLGSDKKYDFRIGSFYRRAYMHRGMISGTMLFLRNVIGSAERLLAKILLPNSYLRRYASRRLGGT